MIRESLTWQLSSAFFGTFGVLFTWVFISDRRLRMTWWFTLMLTGLVVPIRASPPRAMLCSSATTWSPGPPSVRILSLAPVQKLSNGVAEASWLRQLLHELHIPLRRATIVYCDNVSAVYMSSNPVQHQRTKHIEIDLHFVREKVAMGAVRVLHVPTTSQFADVFTKGLPSSVFTEFRSSLNVRG